MERIVKQGDNPKISVIIPVYGVEKFIEKCVVSLLEQTYSNLELLFVDDATPDRSVEIIQRYGEKDARIRILRHEKNQGLFRARVTGMEAATGDYIAFVDSDDHVSCDWFRLLLNRIRQEDADMVLGNTVNEDEAGRKTYYNNYRSLTKSNRTLRGKEVLAKLLDQEGTCFAWHTVWNKLYRRSLVEKCMPYFRKIDRHLIMGEDIAYASVFFSMADSLAFADADAYFYYRHSEASTSLSLPKNKIQKNVEDIGFVFQYAEECIKDITPNGFEALQDGFFRFKDRYFRTWSSNLTATGYHKDPQMVKTLCTAFGRDELEAVEPHEFYFYEISTTWNSEFEKVKKLIAGETIQYVSFDIFDTLIKRAVYYPTDIFYLMAERPELQAVFQNSRSFFDKRIFAEQIARERLNQSGLDYQDVTLSEIYDAFCDIFHFPKEFASRLQAWEEETEYKFCFQRESARELFDLALHLGKTVVLTSDMYLSEQAVRRILEKNGYQGYQKLYLSSEQRRLKATGSLYEFVIKDLKIQDRSSVLHIGDTWNSDIVEAQKHGIRTYFIPKCREIFENVIPQYATNDLSAVFRRNLSSIVDNKKLMEQLPIRCMLAVVINKLFDNPYQRYQQDTDYNSDSYLTGYYTLGMHMFGLVSWMYEICKRENYRALHFLARDGRLAKQIFDRYCEAMGDDSIPTDYFYATRKALLPYLIHNKSDFYDLNQYIEWDKHTPEDILQMYAPVLKPLTEELREQYRKSGVRLEESFGVRKDFIRFIDTLIRLSFDDAVLGSSDKQIGQAIETHFGPHEATFDIGYSGRLQSILSQVAGKPIDAFYVHQEGRNADALADRGGFRIHTFYNFTPKMSGIVREFFISDPAPSCTGYRISDTGVLEPILEDRDFPYQKKYPIRKFQQGALDFCQDMLDIFSDMLSLFRLRPLDASAAFEYYLLNAKQCDRYVYSVSEVEDTVYSGYDARSLFDIWSWHLNQMERSSANPQTGSLVSDSGLFGHERYPFLKNRSKLEKAWFYFWHDRSVFYEKFKFWRKVWLGSR